MPDEPLHNASDMLVNRTCRRREFDQGPLRGVTGSGVPNWPVPTDALGYVSVVKWRHLKESSAAEADKDMCAPWVFKCNAGAARSLL